MYAMMASFHQSTCGYPPETTSTTNGEKNTDMKWRSSRLLVNIPETFGPVYISIRYSYPWKWNNVASSIADQKARRIPVRFGIGVMIFLAGTFGYMLTFNFSIGLLAMLEPRPNEQGTIPVLPDVRSLKWKWNRSCIHSVFGLVWTALRLDDVRGIFGDRCVFLWQCFVIYTDRINVGALRLGENVDSAVVCAVHRTQHAQSVGGRLVANRHVRCSFYDRCFAGMQLGPAVICIGLTNTWNINRAAWFRPIRFSSRNGHHRRRLACSPSPIWERISVRYWRCPCPAS